MRAQIQVRPVRSEEEARAASAVALAAFDRFVAPHYSEEGRATFHKYAAGDFLLYRLSQGETGFIAVEDEGEGERVVGMATARSGTHLAMLFVHPDAQRKGIGRALLDEVVRYVKQATPGLDLLTVHSSPNAHDAYLRFGFKDTGPEVEDQGIRSIPMALPL